MRGERSTTLRERYGERLSGLRPYFIDEQSWSIFLAHVRDGRTIRDIARSLGLSPPKIETVISRVQRDLDIPRPQEAESGEITLDSPIEDLALSGRARNSLRKAGCGTIRSLLERDFSRAVSRLGPITRDEIKAALQGHGFDTPATLTEEKSSRLAEIGRELKRLREQIHLASQNWQSRVERLELRLKKLHGQAG